MIFKLIFFSFFKLKMGICCQEEKYGLKQETRKKNIEDNDDSEKQKEKRKKKKDNKKM